MGLLGKLLSVGTVMGISPELIAPLEKAIKPREDTVFIPCSPGCTLCEGGESGPKFTLAS